MTDGLMLTMKIHVLETTWLFSFALENCTNKGWYLTDGLMLKMTIRAKERVQKN